MRYRAALAAAMLGMAVGISAAGDAPAAKDFGQKKLADLRAASDAARYDEVIAGAGALSRASRDEAVRMEAARLAADALRKKGDWRPAAKAYRDLAALSGKGSDGAVRAEAVAEVLEVSPQGLYHALRDDKEFGPPRTLSDDGVLAAALERLAERRAAKLAPRLAAMKTAATPTDVVAIFQELAEAYRQLHVVAPGFSLEPERQAARAAAECLEAIDREVRPKLRDTLVEAEREIAARRTVTSAQKEQLEAYAATCQKMADAEEAFRQALEKVGGQGWPERGRLGLQSAGRRTAYGLMAGRFHWLSLRPVGRWPRP